MQLEKVYQDLLNSSTKFKSPDLHARREYLIKLKETINKYEIEIKEALYKDFKKTHQETDLTEILPTIHEINFALKNLKKWMKDEFVPTPFFMFGARSKIIKEPKGLVLIMSPWNYPFNLVFCPLVSAIAAGCRVLIRPSEKTIHTSNIIFKIINECFSPEYINVILGDIEISKRVLDLRFDHIFFTGSTQVGKIVMEKASRHLCSVTLELGGKSPVIIDRKVDLEIVTAKLAWAKLLNAGQTCIAPDYVFIPKEIKEVFLDLLNNKMRSLYDSHLQSDLTRIIDAKNFKRLEWMIESEKKNTIDSLNASELYFPPTVLFDISASSNVMSEEIFGPILPVLTYESIDEVLSFISNRERPLALYLFSNDRSLKKKVEDEISCGAIVVNDLLVHFSNPHLPFGGVGHSGMGASHGKHGFMSFTHLKPVVIGSPFFINKLFYPPYNTFLSRFAYKILSFLK